MQTERKLVLVKKGVARVGERRLVQSAEQTQVGTLRVLREGSTGQFVSVVPKVHAVAEEASQPQVEHKDGAVQNVAPQVAFYRKYTEALLRRYQRLAKLNGRVPSLLGRELFRAEVSHYTVRSFDEVVIFCADVEKCMERLRPAQRAVLRLIALQGYSQGETALRAGISLRHCRRSYHSSLDRLTQIFLEAGLLAPPKCCQVSITPFLGVK